MLKVKSSLITLLVLSALFAAASLELSAKAIRTRKASIVIWSWREDDHLDFLAAKTNRVAYHAKTIMLGESGAGISYARKNLKHQIANYSIPVYRIEKAFPDKPASKSSFNDALSIIKVSYEAGRFREIQIDFDCPAQDRQAYLNFLSSLKSSLSDRTTLSITALASWCFTDRWLKDCAGDESVGMFFSMGSGSAKILQELKKTGADSGAPGFKSVGISLGQGTTNKLLRESGVFKRAHRIFLFSPLAWTKSKYNALTAEVGI